jgi:PBSX family phage terminase large subunit
VRLTLPVGKQRSSIVESNARINIWDGAVRSGKTIASIIRWLDHIARGPQGDLLMAGKTERTLKRNVIDTITDIVGTDQCRVNWGLGEARILGRRVYLLGANDARSEEKLRGLTLAGLYGDELTTWYPDFFGMSLSRLSLRNAKFFGSTNPDTPSHWLKRDWIDRAAELGIRHFHFSIEDNPSLDPEYVAALKKEYVGVWYQRFILGLWVQAAGAIFDAWNEARHVEAELPAILRRWAAIDYGRYNPFVCQIQGLGDDGRVHIMHEYRYDGRAQKRQKSEVEYVKDVLKWYASLGEPQLPEYWWVDPSAISFMSAMWQAEVENVRAADNDVEPGLQLMASALSPGEDRLRVHASCAGLRTEFPGYSWDEKAATKGIEKPLKRDDHSMDALRYGLMGSKRIWNSQPVDHNLAVAQATRLADSPV